MFPQIHPDNIALCLNENDCDFGLTVSRLSMETPQVTHEKVVISNEKPSKKSRNPPRVPRAQRNTVHNAQKIRETTTAESNTTTELNLEVPIANLHIEQALIPSASNECSIITEMQEPEVRDCVVFETSLSELIRNVESPCVVFPFSVSSQIASMPISFPQCSN